MKIVFSFLITLFILTGCTSSLIANQYLIQSPMTIETSEFNSYLIGHTNKGSFNVYKVDTLKQTETVTHQYFINADGSIFNPAWVNTQQDNPSTKSRS
ncbi:hypothetical protein ACFFLZ_02620 [Photobacterium aphoticum]|uniref:Lipoprotein n=1 Tax=Photobacterium aphoticum TaxID=754436 RepID=A0A0J1GUG5_9GAMM|nr:hypothetical protein [Photobacterium aphoticum]KLV03074.1 hypothetical protein ABT58_00675 [Photobacterium aphoticum]PSU58006.1 hypothetical protein C9I90_08020 [Photobacterium aphoticum]GHA52235.1 hypothetical protein GCM10007086_27990 [Photobacterium aphoticum]